MANWGALGPRAGPARAGGHHPDPRATVTPAMPDILLVADLPWVTEAVRAALSGTGSDLTVTTDPAAAADLALERQVEVVLVDLQVGSMGGMAVARAVRTQARTAGATPPALVLLLDREADAFLAGRAAADGWIRKPFSAFALRRLVKRLAAERAGQPVAT